MVQGERTENKNERKKELKTWEKKKETNRQDDDKDDVEEQKISERWQWRRKKTNARLKCNDYKNRGITQTTQT